jgi:hypothetical protein
VTALDWALLGLTICSLWLLMDVYTFIARALSSGFSAGPERREFQFGAGVAGAAAFFVSAVVAALFDLHPLLVPIVDSVFVLVVTSGIGFAYLAVLLTKAIGWLERHLPSTGR